MEIGKEIKFLVFFKEFKNGDKIVATHYKWETSKIKDIISVNSDLKEGWSNYRLLMENGRTLEYFSPKSNTNF
jgi:hypothetical protein